MVLKLAGRPLGVGGSDSVVWCDFDSDKCHRGGLEKTLADCGVVMWLIVPC
ncbi:hypothetical protein Nmel_010929 [Mimus melanotis]